jgi:hypothetical protein
MIVGRLGIGFWGRLRSGTGHRLSKGIEALGPRKAV